MAIKEYSCTKDGERFLGPNFRVREFACQPKDRQRSTGKSFLNRQPKDLPCFERQNIIYYA